jgi:hypothetical protein
MNQQDRIPGSDRLQIPPYIQLVSTLHSLTKRLDRGPALFITNQDS